MDGFERKKEQSQKAIIEAAIELFRLHGFKKASISDIARAADVSPVTIYNHFGSKEGLVRETVKVLLTRMLEKVREIVREDKPFPEKLETIIFDKAKLASDYRGELMREMARSDPELADWVDTFFMGDARKVTLELMDKGKKEGYVAPGLSNEMLLLYLELIRRGAMASPDLIAQIEPDVEAYRKLNSLFIYGLVGKKD